MNKAYRLIWSKAKERWIVAAEIIKGNGGPPPLTVAIAIVTSLIMAVSGADALPTGGQVAAGQAAISMPSATQMNITQGTNQAIINWNSFGIGRGEAVTIAQPSSQSTLLNRVLGNNPSQIFGSLTANGQVFLVNPGGVLFAPGSSVNVGGLVASSLNIKDSDFLAGKYSFFKDGTAGSVVNQGSISSGFVALLGNSVENAGTIITTKGTTGLAAGDEITLGFDPNGLMAIKVDKAVYNAQVSNSGVIEADGGTVVMTAGAADALLATVVNNSGTIRARGMVERNGEIVIEGGASGIVENSGTLDVSSAEGKGGKIVVTGENVLVKSGSHLNASGATGGGEVLVGGSWQNSDPAIRQATATIVEQGALLTANATDTGNGGTVVAWSDVNNLASVTRAYGTFEAKGGPNGGDGGRIETSGHWLDVAGVSANASASIGKSGEWLLDPYNVTIAGSGASGTAYSSSFTPTATSTILASAIVGSLDAGTSVTITTGTSGTDAGNISVISAIVTGTTASSRTLTLTAANNVALNANISNSTGTLAVVLNAGVAIISYGNGTLAANGGVSFNAAGDSSISGVISGSGGITKTGAGTLKLRATTNSYTGATTINGGKLWIEEDHSLGTAPGSATPGKLVFDGGTLVLANASGITLNANRGILLNAGGGTIEEGVENTTGNTSIYNGNMTGTGSFTRTNSAVNFPGLSLGGVNTYEGATYINSGKLLTSSTTALPQYTAVTVASGAYLYVNTPNTTVGSITGAGTVQMEGGTLTAGGNNTDTTFSGAITGSYGLIKEGSGTLTISNSTNTYRGTTVNAGTLAVTTGNVLSYVTQSLTLNGGTLAAIGDVNLDTRAVTLTANSTISVASGKTISGGVFSAGSNTLTLTGGGDFTLTTATNNFGTVIIPNAGNVSLVDANALTLGEVSASGTVDVATLSGNLDLSGAVATTNASASAITLNAGQSTAAGTTTGGDIISGGSVSVGTGGTAKLFSGSIASSTGLAAIATAGARYNSDETTTLSSVLGTGLYALYRQPTGPTALTFTLTETTKVYGDANPTLPIYSLTSGSFASGDSVSGLSWGSAATQFKAVGTYGYGTSNLLSPTFTCATAGCAANYSLTWVNSFVVAARPLTVTADAKTKIYGAADPALSYQISAGTLVNSDPFSGALSRSTGSNVGSYAINQDTLSLGANYTLSYVSANLGITQKPLTVTGSTASNKTYDGTTAATITGETLSGVLLNDVVTVSGGGSFADKNVANSKAVTAALILDGADAGNYNLTQPTGLTANISKADLIVTGLTASNKTYDTFTTATLGGTATVTALAGDTVTLGGTAAGTFADKTAANGKAVTVTGKTLTGSNDDGNYNLIQQSGLTANISKADLSVTGLTASNKTYDTFTTATLGGTAAVTALSGDTVTLGGTAAGTFADKAAANGKVVTVTGKTLTGSDDDGNYNLIQQSGLTANISKADLTVTGLTASNKTYDTFTTATLGGTAAVTALAGDAVTLGGTAAGTFADKTAANNKAVTATGVTLSGTGADNGNYNLIQQSGLTANISKADLIVSGLTASNKTYDTFTTATLGGTATVTALGSDVVTLGGTASGSFADKTAADNKAVTVTGKTLTGSNDDSNYTLIQQSGLTANISKADLSVTGLTASNKTYDTFTTATLGGTATVTALAGDTVTLGGTAAGTFADKTAANNKAVTVTGKTLTGSNDDGNYNLIQQSGLTANISKADLTVSGLTASNKTYDSTNTATLGGTAAISKLSSDDVTIGGTAAGTFADKNFGTGKNITVTGNTISGTDATNYNLIQQSGLTANISKADLTVTGLTVSNKTYDTFTTATLGGTATVTALGSDVVTLGGTASGTFADKTAADNKAVTVTGNILTGSNDDSNYTLIQQSGLTANISKADLSVSGLTASNKTYDTFTTATLGGTAAVTALAGDTVTLGGTAAGQFDNKNFGTGKNITVTGNTISGGDATNYTLIQQSGLTANISKATLTTTGAVAQNKVYDA
ncbi:MAG: filamentous hemagglutinin N-terminal domain-containing protein, partial [Deltaproteobacteria bacterium]|nr:filamentous hemagglutinin N-terminal domain-containing protein [Deltaproteobacteria bacterium]